MARLARGEHSVLGYFPDSGSAQAAADELKGLGIEAVQVDRVSRYEAESDAHYNNPVGGQAVQQSALSTFSAGGGLDDDAGPLLAADPAVSGMAADDYGVAGGSAFLVTAVTTGPKLNQAIAAIKRNGGTI